MISVYLSPNHSFLNLNCHFSPGWHRTPQFVDFFRSSDIKIYHDLDEFKSSLASVKISFDDFDSLKIHNKLTNDQLQDHVSTLSEISDWVFLVETEMYYHEYVLLVNPNYIPPDNVRWLMPGTVNEREKYIIDWQFHLWRIANLYRTVYEQYLTDKKYHGWLSHDLSRLDEPIEKKYVFDALLGTPREQRVWLKNQLSNRSFRDLIMLRILPKFNNEENLPLPEDSFYLEPEWKFEKNFYVAPTVSGVSYGTDNCIVPSNVIPVTAYQQCYFSIISETGCENHTHMVTEKTAKVLLAKRLFLAIAGKGFMRYLRSLGFQTFGSIIDESYDDIEDNHQRWSAVIAEVERICQGDYQDIWHKSKDIVEHNQKIMLTRDFLRSPVNDMEELIESLISG